MLFGKEKFDLDRTVRWALALMLLAAIIHVLDILSDAILPFVIASCVAYLLNPLVLFFERKTNHRFIGVILCLFLLLSTLFLTVTMVYPRVVSEGHNFLMVVKELGEKSDLAKRAAERLPEDLWGDLRHRLADPKLKEWLKSGSGSGAFSFLSSYVSPSFLGVVEGTKSFLFLLVEILVILLYLFFILLDYPKLLMSAKHSIPKPMRATVSLFAKEFDEALSRYFRAQALVATIVGVLFGFGFFLIGLPMPWLLGLMMGILNLVPYLQLLGVIPVAILSLVTALEGNASFLNVGLSSLAVLLVVQALQDMVIVPKVMGKASGLSPAVMLLSLTIWGQLLGFLGLILAIPITCLSLVWYHRLFFHDDEIEAPH